MQNGYNMHVHLLVNDCTDTLYKTEWMQHAGETSLNTCIWSIVHNGIDNPYNTERIQHAGG